MSAGEDGPRKPAHSMLHNQKLVRLVRRHLLRLRLGDHLRLGYYFVQLDLAVRDQLFRRPVFEQQLAKRMGQDLDVDAQRVIASVEKL